MATGDFKWGEMSLETLSSFEETPLGQMALEKAKELFGVCDDEGKGFIIKRDMQKLQNELPGLTPDQLEEVFDSLDQDRNGFLTMEEFVKGFGAFLGLQIPEETTESATNTAAASELYSADNMPSGNESEQPVEKEQFQALMEEIGASEVLSDKESVQQMWSKLRKDDPELLQNFEHFLGNISTELKKSKDEFSTLETALQQKTTLHDQQIQNLYNEMEQQIKEEKERALEEERRKMDKMQEDMENEILKKDSQLQELLNKHSELERKISDMKNWKTTTEQEKEKLLAERKEFEQLKNKMEIELEHTQKSLDETKDHLEFLKDRTKEEKRDRARSAFRVTEGIANEREDLVIQLDSLRTLNKQLKDQQDAKESPTMEYPEANKRPSVIGPYLTGRNEPEYPTGRNEPEYPTGRNEPEYPAGRSEPGYPIGRSEPGAFGRGGMMLPLEEQTDDEDVDLSTPLARLPATTAVVPRFGTPTSLMDELGHAQSPDFDPGKLRGEPVGGNEMASMQTEAEDPHTPERIFKVVFVGDSGVGKTCFLHRFCHDRFKPTFSATIGVDFQVKSIRVDNKLVALQLWDTAGQERFRSITKQYFRKADGVIMVYDVTSEQSFLNIRSWMLSVKEGVEKDCVLCIVGNKVDMCDSEEERAVTFKDGQKLADNYETLFYETSAQTGLGIQECMHAMAILLREREDEHLEEALKLEEMEVVPRKKGCCNR